jgi:large conductance mechanosensitive channel
MANMDSQNSKTKSETIDQSKVTTKPTAAKRYRVAGGFQQPVSGFTEFLRQNAIIGLAVGFVVGTQVQGVVKQLIASFINPLSALLFGGTALSSRTFTVHFNHQSANFGWGQFVYTLVDFLFVLIVIYIIIKSFKLDKLDKPKS